MHLEPGQLFTDKVMDLLPDDFKKIAQLYTKSVWELSPDSKWITDKMPANFLYIGMIHIAFPNAKIIHAMRDPLDTCFSCYARLFNDTMDIAYDLETLGRYYVMYRQLMAHWHQVLPEGTILDLSYEEMVADSEGQTRRILNYVGLPWDDRCLEFYKNERLVKTASLAQVNKPIYKSSVERWRHFAKHLHPLIELVKEYRQEEVYPEPASKALMKGLAPSPVSFFEDLIQQCLGLQAKDQHEQVLQVLAPYLKPELNVQNIWHLVGISFYRLLRFAESKACYEKALSIQPDAPLVLNSYGFLLQDIGMMREALAAYERAVEIAKSLYEENQRLKGTVDQNQNTFLESAKAQLAKQIEDAKGKYKQAYEAGDADALVEAQDELTSAKVKLDRIGFIRPKPLQEAKNEVQIDQAVNNVPRADVKAESWQRANSWFGQDKEMTGFALALHDKLVNDDGVDPSSDEYYQRLNGRLRQVFPGQFESEGQAESSGSRKKSNVVASASRSVAPRKIVLSQSEVNIAKRLGIPLKEYAREASKLRRG
jgi:tetratricopeptide (TPR) repeat protein